eukprot:16327152-Heterocapsa_arctica.AAC.1
MFALEDQAVKKAAAAGERSKPLDRTVKGQTARSTRHRDRPAMHTWKLWCVPSGRTRNTLPRRPL